MDESCLTCHWARLPVNKEIQATHVGCLFHSTSDDDSMIKLLQEMNYNFPDGDVIRTGWIYNRIPPNRKREDYDIADAGIISNFCLITPKCGYCKAYCISNYTEFEYKYGQMLYIL